MRFDGALVTPVVAGNGRDFRVTVPALPVNGSGTLSYIATVREDAVVGDAVNRAQARDSRGTTSPIADVAVRIDRDGISERFARSYGRMHADGGCAVDPRKANGIANVRVMMEDGTYTVTDADGRYHFEGVRPGLHVVQVDPSTFPIDLGPVDCTQNTRSAGSAISRFVEGQGGALKRADFRATAMAQREMTAAEQYQKPVVITDPEAAGAERDWFTGQQPGIDWLFPEPDHNPRVKAIRVAIKHLPGQKVELSVNGKRANPLAFDGQQKSADGQIAVSVWRGLELQDRANQLTARIVGPDGTLVQELTRSVHYSASALNAQLLRERSVLIADGVTRPVIAVRLTDRDGRPAHHGLVGDFALPSPYLPAIEVDAQQANQLSGLERGRPVWRIEGDDGIAYIELAPTTASGSLSISFPFQDGEVKRTQRIETWLEPGNRPWTVVGFAAGTAGFNTLNERLEASAEVDDSFLADGRIALYAKGRVTGKWLMTLAYDTDKKEDQTRFAGIIDPRSYYTVYADRSEQRYDAASVRKLYLKLERPQFYALFGDYQTGIDEPELARYQRAFNGVKAEYRDAQVHAIAFGADTPNRFRREEIQGNGLSGPYALAARDIYANSERITIEVRDRLRSDRIIERRELTRHIDYDIDYLAGTLTFRQPILSRSSGLDPQFIIAEYEVLGIGGRDLNAGGRASWQSADEKIKIAATAVHNEDNISKTDLLGVDVRYRPTVATEVRAELAVTDGRAKAGAAQAAPGAATAWLVEAEHHGAKVDLLAYVRRQATGFGLGQINAAESGTRKFGVDARVRMTNALSFNVTSYQEDFLDAGARRRAALGEVEYRKGDTSFRAGITHAEDQLADGRTNRSTLARLGATQRLLGGKLELDAQTEFALGGQNESIDFPAKHSFTARYALTDSIKLIGTYEIADGKAVDARTARFGVDVAPWAGGRIVSSVNQQQISEYGPRTFAAYGLTQSFKVSDSWSLDFTLDGNKTLSGFNRNDVINPAQPVAAGGFLGNSGSLTEDFVAVTAGSTYRSDDWSMANRIEYRDGDFSKRYGFTSAILKQIGEGNTLGALGSVFVAEAAGGVSTRVTNGELSWAYRPSDSQWSWLEKVELREDKVRNAIEGAAGPIGGAPFLVNGDVTSRRIINSLSINYTPLDESKQGFAEAGEYSLFWGSRYVFDKFGPDDVEGWSNIVGIDAKFDLSDTVDIGGQATARIGNNFDTVAYSGGPSIGITPFENGYISIGYNVVGFADRDFEENRYTRDGPFMTFRLKFDQNSLAALGF
ncbi:MAG: carboxypeptidase-like regulatory domain-containing protein [Parasphingorhabdus sp.]|nr:carboxypeptidase-like regulatory domain-containing protein [Parasphingorhabdus sp.]